MKIFDLYYLLNKNPALTPKWNYYKLKINKDSPSGFEPERFRFWIPTILRHHCWRRKESLNKIENFITWKYKSITIMKKSPLKFLNGANEFFMYKIFTYILSFTPCTLFKVGGKASASSYPAKISYSVDFAIVDLLIPVPKPLFRNPYWN